MFSIRDWNRVRQARSRSRRIMDIVRFRQNLNEVRLNQRNMENAHADMTARAVEAEKGGAHALAVHWAGEAQKLKNYLMMSGNMKDAAEAAHAIRQTNMAMKDLLTTAGSLAARFNAPDPCALQAEAAELQSNAQIILEESGQLLDELPDDPKSESSEAAEKYLQELMRAASQEKRTRMLQDANRKLDQLQRSRNAEKPR